jgi:hypothetical protein
MDDNFEFLKRCAISNCAWRFNLTWNARVFVVRARQLFSTKEIRATSRLCFGSTVTRQKRVKTVDFYHVVHSSEEL